MPNSHEAPYSVEKEADDRYRIKARNEYIGDVINVDDRWLIKREDRTHGPYDTICDAVLALYLLRTMSQLD
jgi:hypothetical protein